MMKGTNTRGGRSGRQSSKVYTSKGPRDRRVRLSAHTAIQFYDVQDRLGYDRPSKAIDWLMSKAKASIDNLTTYNETNNNLQPAPSKDNSNPSCSREPLPMDHHPELLLGYPPILQPNDTNSSFFRTTCLGFPGLANDPPLTRAGELDHLCLSLQTNFQDIISFERMDDGWNSSGGGDHIMNNSQQTIMFSQPQQLLHSNLVFHGQYQSSTDHSGQHFDVGFGVPARNNDPPRYDN